MASKKILLLDENPPLIAGISAILSTAGHEVYIVGSTNQYSNQTGVRFFSCTRNQESCLTDLLKIVTNYIGWWDMVVDTADSLSSDYALTCALLGGSSSRFIFMSTPLVGSSSLIPLGEGQDYTKRKNRMENYIRTQTLPWTILRPYHIVGPGSLLGCIPDHNRDPELVARLQRGEALELCNGGDIDFNIVHPADIGRAVLAVAENPATIHKAYNCVNPEPVKARDYYAEIARQVGGTLKIKTKSYQEVWDEQGGWELTSLPHVYDVSDLERDTGFVPRVSYQECIRDALAHPPAVSGDTSTIPVHQRMTALPRPRRFSWLPN